VRSVNVITRVTSEMFSEKFILKKIIETLEMSRKIYDDGRIN
jgi:hypothetical protein